MITNDRQYHIAMARAKGFRDAVERLGASSSQDPIVAPELRRAQIESALSVLAEISEDIDAYEALRDRGPVTLELSSFDQVPSALVKARVAAGLNQRELADRLGLREQQVQRYEASGYASASLTRIREVAEALGVVVRDEWTVPSSKLSLNQLWQRLRGLDIPRNFALGRLLPRQLSSQIENAESDVGHEGLALQAASAIARVLGLDVDTLLAQETLTPSLAAAGAARFKRAARARETWLGAYAEYAHFLALLTLAAAEHLPSRPIPTGPGEVRARILGMYGELTLLGLARYIWELGVPVLPLQDAGAFHGACWRAAGRSVIVLKQRGRSSARWVFDLLHEMHHAGQEPMAPDLTVVEGTHVSVAEEAAANAFAGDVLLDGRAEELARLCVEAASGDVARLKRVLPKVAARESVDVAQLANYLAYRLSSQGLNWWGTAQHFQPDDDPFALLRDLWLDKVDLSRLTPEDQDLLIQALSPDKEAS